MFHQSALVRWPGKKQDLWHVVDLLTGEKQQTLTSSFAEMLCPSSSLLYLGRTGKAAPLADRLLNLPSTSANFDQRARLSWML